MSVFEGSKYVLLTLVHFDRHVFTDVEEEVKVQFTHCPIARPATVSYEFVFFLSMQEVLYRVKSEFQILTFLIKYPHFLQRVLRGCESKQSYTA